MRKTVDLQARRPAFEGSGRLFVDNERRVTQQLWYPQALVGVWVFYFQLLLKFKSGDRHEDSKPYQRLFRCS
jgi:hypothetical protein